MDYDSFRLILSLSIIAFFFVAIIAASLWEKRPVQPYYVPAEGDEYEPSAEAEEANKEAQEAGYQHGGLCHDGKGRLYRVRYDFWIAPNQCTLAIVGSGTVARVPVNGVSLYSHAAGGRVLWTTNNKGEQDISGVTEPDAWPKLSFTRLLAKHNHRLAKSRAQPFPEGSPMAGYFAIRKRQADGLVQQGLARYLDDTNTAWRYTLKGAFKFYIFGIWIRPFGRALRSADPKGA
jgi:hypothetical protein